MKVPTPTAETKDTYSVLVAQSDTYSNLVRHPQRSQSVTYSHLQSQFVTHSHLRSCPSSPVRHLQQPSPSPTAVPVRHLQQPTVPVRHPQQPTVPVRHPQPPTKLLTSVQPNVPTTTPARGFQRKLPAPYVRPTTAFLPNQRKAKAKSDKYGNRAVNV